MKRFEWVEHPSDIGFRAYGRDLAEAFENAALAFFEVMVDTSKVEPREEVAVELEELRARGRVAATVRDGKTFFTGAGRCGTVPEE